MPLIIAVVAIIVIFVVMKDKGEDNARDSANREKMMRKTNATLERKVFNDFLRQGMTFDEAYDATLYKMPRLGFDPCIPKDAYGDRDNRFNSSWIFNPEEYDSETVKRRRDELKRAGQTVTDEALYGQFPTNAYEYSQGLKHSTLVVQAIKVGDCFIYPGYGTCKVLAYSYSPDGTKGTYSVQVLKTGEVVNTIKIGDSKIRHMNSNFWD